MRREKISESWIPDISIVEMLKSESEKAERIEKLTDNQLRIVYHNEWFKMLVPRIYNGLELDLPDFADFIERLAGIDGSLAWNVNLGAGANMFSGYMKPEVAYELFRDREMCIAGSGAATGIAYELNSSYTINGSWKYASGSAHATHFSFNASVIDRNNQEIGIRSFIIPRAQVEIIENWHPCGLIATSSHDFRIVNQKIPKEFCFDLARPSEHVPGVLYRFPFLILAEINMAAMSTGLAMRFLQIIDKLRDNLEYGNGKALLPGAQFLSARKKVVDLFFVSRNAMWTKFRELWSDSRDQKFISPKKHREFTKIVLTTIQAARRLVHELYPFAGMNGIFPANESNRVWRDFNVASQHALLNPARLDDLQNESINPR